MRISDWSSDVCSSDLNNRFISAISQGRFFMKSQLVLKLSALTRSVGRSKRSLVLAAALGAGAMLAAPVYAQATKIGFVSTERILRDSKPAKADQSKIEAEFKKRDNELQNLANKLRSDAQKFDKEEHELSESERVKRQRQLADLDSDLQRKRREFQEDFNRRRNEEFSGIVEKADAAIKKIAEQQGSDLIIQDARSE